jgi:hypothetical protein
MVSTELLRLEAAHYRVLAEQLKSQYETIDDQTLTDTMQGISELPQMVETLVRSGLDDGELICGLKSRLENMSERLSRLKERYEKKRALVAWAMGNSGITKLEVPDFSVSLCAGAQKLEIAEPTIIPQAYLIPQPPKIDRASISAALKRGEIVEGATLATGNPFIAVRSK